MCVCMCVCVCVLESEQCLELVTYEGICAGERAASEDLYISQ